MPAPDLIPVLRRVEALAREIDRSARRPDAVCVASSEAIIRELTGASPHWKWRSSVGPDAATVVCLAKAIRILASMLAAREGVAISLTGVLEDMGPPDR